MGVVRGHVEEERLAAFGDFAQERFDPCGIHVGVRLGQLLERKCAHRRDVPFALHGHPVAALFQISGQGRYAVVDVGVVGIGARPHGVEAREQAVARGRAHRRRLEEPREAQTLRCQPVDVGRHGVGTAVAAEVEHARVVRDDEHDVGPFGGRGRRECREGGGRHDDAGCFHLHLIRRRTGSCGGCA